VAQANVKLTVNATQATSALKGVQNQTKQTNAGINKLKTAIAGIGIGVLAKQAISTSANFEKLNVRLGLLTKASGTFARSQELAAQAQRAFGLSATEALEGITDITARLQPLGVGVEDIKTTFFGFNTAAKLAGASAIESSNAFRQLAQALGSGRLQGDEFRSISEQIPTILKPVADELGTTVGELKKFSSEGKITSGVVIRALKKIETEGGASLAALLKNDPTQVFKNLSNETENLSRAFGDRLAPAILPVIRAITNLTKATTEFVNSGAGQVTLTLLAATAAIKGISIVVPILSAQIIALKTNFIGMQLAAAFAKGQLTATTTATLLTTGGFAKATAAAVAFKLALAKTGIGLVVIALGTLAAKFIDNKNAAEASAKAAKEFDNNIKGITESAKESTLELLNQTLATKENALAEVEASKAMGNAKRGRDRKIKALKEEIKQAKINIGVEKRRQSLNKKDKFNELITNNLKEQFKLQELINGKTEEEVNLEQQILQIKKDFEAKDAAEIITQLKITNGLKEKLDLIKKSKDEAKKLQEAFESIGQEIETSIKDNLRGAITGAQSFGQAMTNVLNRIRDKIIDAQLDRLLSGFGDNFKKSGGKGLGGFLGGIIGGLFANGGRPPVGKASIVGERGPELFVPKVAGTIIPNDNLGGGSVSNMVTVNVDASGSSVSGNNADAQALGAAIGAAVQAQLIKEKRPGGILTR